MAEYKYGVYGSLGTDIVQSASQASVVPVYFGTAPVNLLTDYKGAVNTPIKIYNLSEAKSKLGHFADATLWGKYTLCEAIEAHFNNANGNIGPIYVINVLDPDKHKAEQAVTVPLTFANRKASIVTTGIIIATFAIEGKVLGTDYTLSYNADAGVLTVTDIGTTEIKSATASYSEIDFDTITADDIVGGTDSEGVTSGIASLRLVYQNYDAIPTYIAAPGWSETPAVYTALVAASQGINDHWSAFVFADIPTDEAATIDAAIKWKKDNGYNSGFSKVFWPKVKGNKAVYHLSTLALVEKVRCDTGNDSVPYETCANKAIPVSGLYISASSKLVGYDRPDANKLTAAGLTTAIYWESNWRVWGDHTAAYDYDGEYNAREIFDSNILMLFYITNSFQKEWGSTIDKPMTLALRDTILNREQEKLEMLVSKGALIGSPTITLATGSAGSSEASDILIANFEWHVSATVTPPLKAATVVVSYTDAGFQILYGGEE